MPRCVHSTARGVQKMFGLWVGVGGTRGGKLNHSTARSVWENRSVHCNYTRTFQRKCMLVEKPLRIAFFVYVCAFNECGAANAEKSSKLDHNMLCVYYYANPYS